MQQRMILSRIRIRVFFYPLWYPYRFRFFRVVFSVFTTFFIKSYNCRIWIVVLVQNIDFGFTFSAFRFNKDKDTNTQVSHGSQRNSSQKLDFSEEKLTYGS